jgi:superfamily II DNA or RNA helicase
MQDNKLVADVVETWKELGEGRPTLGYAVDCAHAQHMMERFNKAGIPAGYIDAKTDVLERRGLQAKLEAGILKVVWSVGTLVKGTDWKISCGIDCQPTKSHKRHVQKCGRVIRTTTGEQHGLWLDHAGNCLRLGMPVDIDRAELCMAKPGDKIKAEAEAAKMASKCPKCKAVKTAKVCVCGYESKRETDLTEGAGQLARIDGGKSGPKKAEPTLFERQEWYAQLRGYQLAHNKTDGWLAHSYKDKFGAWPNDMRNVLPAKVGGEVANWVKAKNIRFARGMAKYQNRKAG